MEDGGNKPPTLSDILSNSLVLQQLAPYIPLPSAFSLAATSKSIQTLLLESPETFRYLDLSRVRTAQLPDVIKLDVGGNNWRSQRMDEALTPDEFYSGPLRGHLARLQRKNILRHVQTLILDGLSVTAEMVREIISEDKFSVRVLSIREAKLVNERTLMQTLRYAVRPTRPEGTPRLRALYVFGPKETRSSLGSKASRTGALKNRSKQNVDQGVMSSEGAQIGSAWNQRSQDALENMLFPSFDKWYQPSGRMFEKTAALKTEWAETLKACEGIIAFDAVLCRGPRHDVANVPAGSADSEHEKWLPPEIAVVALGPSGCAACGHSPEGPAIFGVSPSEELPLLEPPPLHSLSVRQAQKPSVAKDFDFRSAPFFARCERCLKDRWCERCMKWWDEACYPGRDIGPRNNRKAEVSDQISEMANDYWQPRGSVKVHMGLCTGQCLVGEMMSGAGSFGMWG